MSTKPLDTAAKKDLVIFIPVHKNYVYLSHMLKSIRSERYNLKFYIVNNGSDYDTNRYCKILNRREGFTVEHHKNALGVSRVWNRCLDIAIEKGYEYIVITNSDILFHEACIDIMGIYMDENPHEIMTFPVDIKKVQEVITEYPSLTEEGMNRFKYEKEAVEGLQKIVDGLGVQVSKPVPIEEIVDYSCFMLRPKELVERVGYFDENFTPAYWEDTDMHWRLADQGVRSRALLNAPMLHISSRSLIEGGFNNTSYNPNAFYFIKKHATAFSPQQIIRDRNGNFITVRTFSATHAYEAAEERDPIQVFDCFLFEGDLELLELRLRSLNDTVTNFVIIEAPFDLEGRPKPLYLKDNLKQFEEFLPKIKRLIMPNDKGASSPEVRKELLTKALFRGVKGAGLDDVVIISDLNEIPEPRKIVEFKRLPGTKIFTVLSAVEKVNLLLGDEETDGPRFCSVETLEDNHNNDLYSLKSSPGFKIQKGGCRIQQDTSADLLELVKAGNLKVIPLDHKVIAHFRALDSKRWVWDPASFKHKGSSWVDSFFEAEDE